MSKLTKEKFSSTIRRFCLLQKEHLSHEDKLFIFENFREDAEHINSKSGAFLLLLDLPTILLSRFRAYTERRSELSTCVLESAY